MGCLLFAAGAGVLYLCRAIGLTGPGRYVAAVGFMYTPYVLQYAGRISVILLPWSGLPWLVAFVVLALRRGRVALPGPLRPGGGPDQRHQRQLLPLRGHRPRPLAALRRGGGPRGHLAQGLGGGLEGRAAQRAGLAVVGGRVWRSRPPSGSTSSSTPRRCRPPAGPRWPRRSSAASATGTSTASDRIGPWTQTAVAYTQNIWLIVASFAVPALCFVAAVFSRWRHRAYFVLLTVVGMVLAVGPNPYSDPTGVGSLIKCLLVDTTAGLALRSTDRASPLVVLGLAMFLGGGVSAVAARVHTTGLVVGAFAVAAVAGATVPLWTGGIIADGFTQPAAPPAYVRQAAAALDASHPGTRVYALPGNDFAAYRWGDTIDTVYPGLMTRPFVTHEQQIMGSLATADVLQAVDTPVAGRHHGLERPGPDGLA